MKNVEIWFIRILSINSLFALLNNLSNFIKMKNKNIDIGIWNTLCTNIHVQVHYRIHIIFHIELSCIIDVWRNLLLKNYNEGKCCLFDPPPPFFERERRRIVTSASVSSCRARNFPFYFINFGGVNEQVIHCEWWERRVNGSFLQNIFQRVLVTNVEINSFRKRERETVLTCPIRLPMPEFTNEASGLLASRLLRCHSTISCDVTVVDV